MKFAFGLLIPSIGWSAGFFICECGSLLAHVSYVSELQMDQD